MSNLPTSPALLTPTFLTACLQSAGVLGVATVAAVQGEALSGAFNAQLIRLTLTYTGSAPEAPRTLIAKLPTLDTDLHETAEVFRPGVAENWFYQRGAALTPVRTPRCYYSAVNVTSQSVLLLEDLAPAQPGSLMVGASPAQARLALTELARLHAAWWDAPTRPEIQELTRLQSAGEVAQGLVARLYAEAWPRFLECVPVPLSAEVRAFGEYLVGHIPVVEGWLDSAPRTLIHGDFRLENLLFGEEAGLPACWVLDWEDCFPWCGMFDVAWLLGSGLPVEESHQEEALVRDYHQELLQAGVMGYTWETCWRDYRAVMGTALVQGFLSATPDPASPSMDSRQRLIAERFVAACQRLHLDTFSDAGVS